MGDIRENSAPSAQTVTPRAKLTVWLGWLGFAVILFACYYQVCDMQMIGFLHDDGVYALTAKALATGQGYKLLNLPLPGSVDFMWQVKYPIGYPLLLSLGWLIEPNFPKNLPWLHGLTTLCAVLAIPLLFDYLRKAQQLSRAMAGLICLLVATNFQYMYYATALMSEAPYFLCSLLALWLAETVEGPPSRKRLAGMVAVTVVAFHIRTIGVALIAAIGLGLALRKHWKHALIFSVSALLFTVVPWGLWITTHGVKLTDLNYPLAYVYGGYGIEAAINAPLGGPMAYASAILTQGVLPLANYLPNLLFPQIFQWLNPYPWANSLLSLVMTGFILSQALLASRNRRGDSSALYFLFSLAVISFWMYPNQAIRFLMVLLPWLWLYTLRGGWGILRVLKPNSWPVSLSQHPLRPKLCGVIGCLLALYLLWPGLPAYQLLFRMRSQHLVEITRKTAPLWQDYQAAFQAIHSHAKPSTRIASSWDPVFYLYTNHPTFPLFISSLQRFNGQMTDESYQHLRASLIQYQVKYIVMEPFILSQVFQFPENPVASGLIQRFTEEFKPVYLSPHRMLAIYRFAPAKNSPAMAETKE
jgi:hypothetical protein